MSKCFIEGMGGGAGKLFAVISATYPEGSSCTATNGTKTLRAKTTSGLWLFAIPFAGTWTVTATYGTKTASKTVTITAEGQNESVTLVYELYLYNAGNQCTAVTGGWTQSGYDGLGLPIYDGELESNRMYFAGTSGYLTMFGTKNAVDVSEYSTLEFKGNVVSSLARDGENLCFMFNICTKKSTAGDTSIAEVSTNKASGSFTATIDLKAVNKSVYTYIVLHADPSCEGYITSVKLT